MRLSWLILLIVAFAGLISGCSTKNTGLSPVPNRGVETASYHPGDGGTVVRDSGFTLNVWRDTYGEDAVIDRITLVVEARGGMTVALVGVEGANGLKDLYFDLAYDPERFHPVEVSNLGQLGAPGEMLELSVLSEPGKVYSGQTLANGGLKPGFSGDAVLAEVMFADGPAPQERTASLAPANDQSTTPLTYNQGTGLFTWYAFNNGDYSQDGLVSINDLQPLGNHFQEQNNTPPQPWPVTDARSAIDGDNNGVLNIQDVTPIGQWFNCSTLGGWQLFSSADIGDYPDENDSVSLVSPVAAKEMDEAANAANYTTERLRFEHAVTAVPNTYYWVRPVDLEGNNGTPSNYILMENAGDLRIEQIDLRMDGVVNENSAFGSIKYDYEGFEGVKYFNLTVNETWVIQNVPVISYQGTTGPHSLTMMFDLGVDDGTVLETVNAGAELSDTLLDTMPDGSAVNDVYNRPVNISRGRPEGFSPAGPVNETGGEVVDWAAHSSIVPNKDCGENECVPAAVSNSLSWLRQETGTPPVGVGVDIGTMKDATGWVTTGCAVEWADLKRTYMEENGYNIITDEYPGTDDVSHAATAAECDSALQAIKDGKDVELNGQGHCAAVVAMAKLADGRFVIYVAHDTNQGAFGGGRVEKVIYDPAALDPVAEGGLGFHGGRLNGFVAEYPVPPIQAEYTINQIDHNLDGVEVENSAFGELLLLHPNPVQTKYINLVYEEEWVIQNVPLVPVAGAAGELSVSMMFPLGVEDGTEVTSASAGVSVDDSPRATAPEPEGEPVSVGSGEVEVGAGREDGVEAGEPQMESGGEVEDEVAIRGGFQNQDCGLNECVPAAVSNSLKWMQDQYGAPSTEVGTGIGDMKNVTRWGEGGAAVGWGNLKARYLNDNNTQIVTEAYPKRDSLENEATADDCENAFNALKQGADVELNGAGHCAAIVGAAKLKDGRYVFYVAHDTRQGVEGGQKIEKVIYDPSLEHPVAEGGWGLNGKKLNGFVAEFKPPTTPEAASIKVDQANITHNGVGFIDTNQGDLTVTYEALDTVKYLNFTYNDNWVVRNLPLAAFGAGPGETTTITVPFSLGVETGTDVVLCEYGYSITEELVETAPEADRIDAVMDSTVDFDSGEIGHFFSHSTEPSSENWYLDTGMHSAAFHETFVNQDCGPAECVPAAVSNSLKMLQLQQPGKFDSAPCEIGDMKGATGWTPSGAPGVAIGGDLMAESNWWKLKDAYMTASEDHPIHTSFNTMLYNTLIGFIEDGMDVELRVPGHTVMVVGAVYLVSGDLVLYVAHDRNQAAEGGTVVEAIRFNVSTFRFDGPDWIDGKRFGNGECLYVIERVRIPSDWTHLVFNGSDTLGMLGSGTASDPYWMFTTETVTFDVIDQIEGDVTSDPETKFLVSPDRAGSIDSEGVFTPGPMFSGIFTVDATYFGDPTDPPTLYMNMFSPPPDSISAFPGQFTAEEGEQVLVSVICNDTINPFQYLGGCRVVVNTGNTYVPNSFNIGVPGGGRYTPDGIWEIMGATAFDELDDSLIVPLPAGAHGQMAYDFFVRPQDGSEIENASGHLFNFKLEIHSNCNLGFIRFETVNRTYYQDAELAEYNWAVDSNIGVPGIIMTVAP